MRNRGFTLLEILVVLAILMTGMAALSTLVRSAMKQSTEAEERTTVQVECRNLMNRILSAEIPALWSEKVELPGVEDWRASTTLSPTPLQELTCITITARRYERDLPVVGEEVTLSQWAEKRSLLMGESSEMSPRPIGSLRSVPAAASSGQQSSPFDAVENSFNSSGARNAESVPSTNEVSSIPSASAASREDAAYVIGGVVSAPEPVSAPNTPSRDPALEELLERARARREEEP